MTHPYLPLPTEAPSGDLYGYNEFGGPMGLIYRAEGICEWCGVEGPAYAIDEPGPQGGCDICWDCLVHDVDPSFLRLAGEGTPPAWFWHTSVPEVVEPEVTE